MGDGMTWEKWVIGALSSMVLLFGTLYIQNVNASVIRLEIKDTAQEAILRQYEQRLTTLEESKRNIELGIQRLQSDVEVIKRAVVRPD